MPAEIEAPTEHLHETLHEHAHGHGHGHGNGEGPPPWISQVALTAAIIAVAAAIAALQAGHNANEAMLEQMQATDKWSEFQAKSIKRSLVDTRMEILAALGKEARIEDDKKTMERYEKEKEEIAKEAKKLEHEAEHHMHRHVILARSVTIFQIAIALSAIGALTRKKLVWYGSVAVGILGTIFLVQAML
jgi:hypothetical protein